MQKGLFFNNGGITLINFKKYFLTVALGISIIVTGCSTIQVSETDYRKDAIILDKESDFFSQPDKFKRKHLIFTANVSNVTQYRNDVELLFEANGLGGNTPIAVHYKMKDGENILVKGEVIRVLGEFQRMASRKMSEISPETSVMEFDAWYIIRPLWSRIQIGSLKSTTDADGLLSFNKITINPDSLYVTGTISKGNPLGSNDYNVHLKGSIKDDGTGTYECFDEYDKPLDISGIIKMPDSKTVEIDTPQVQYRFSAYRQMGYSEERINAFGGEKLKTMPAGHYVYKIN